MEAFLQEAKASSRILSTVSGADKNRILREMAAALRTNTEDILKSNALDMADAETNNLAASLKDRLFLDAGRVDAMAVAIEEIAALKEPVGRVLDGWITEEGLKIEKVTVPIGVIGIIYESRPNVTSDTAALSFKSSNVCVLKGGKEAQHSNEAIAKVLQGVLKANDLPEALISLIPDASREGVAKLIKMDKYVDLIVPRGGEGLIRYVSEKCFEHVTVTLKFFQPILNIKVVEGVEGAIDHIVRFGSGHSEAIITENITTAEAFLNGVDAAAVYVNASTRFTDGGAFGFGAEVGISTNKLHARGPMGIEGLTTYKFKIYGSGQIR